METKVRIKVADTFFIKLVTTGNKKMLHDQFNRPNNQAASNAPAIDPVMGIQL